MSSLVDAVTSAAKRWSVGSGGSNGNGITSNDNVISGGSSSSSSSSRVGKNNNNGNGRIDIGLDDDKKNVGILAVEVYTPATYISQADLEEHAGVAHGKYTVGLGQRGLAVTGDAEDVNSICLTAFHALLEKYNVDPREVGRLEVGTETIVDKSKSTKTVLMDLLAGAGNRDVEGATVVNACYGGTAALLNAFLWCESSGWDGRYAVVVAADIAAYARGPARPTSGVGAVAVLVGRDAPLSFDPRCRATHASNCWDFFKPNHATEYPVVDGALSQECYYAALEDVYGRFCDRVDAAAAKTAAAAAADEDPPAPFDAESADYFCFHAPYNKLVQKSYGRLYLQDAIRRRRRREEAHAVENGASRGKEQPLTTSTRVNGVNRHDSDSGKECLGEKADEDDPLAAWLDRPAEETYTDRALDGVLKRLSSESFRTRLQDCNEASRLIGNTYTASVFFGLASLLDRAGPRGDLVPGKSVVVFSYGSGAIATMYMLRTRTPTTQSKFTLQNMWETMQLTRRLESRLLVSPSELDYAMETRARMHRAGAPYSPVYPVTAPLLFPGTYYLTGLCSQWKRTYSRVPPLPAADTDHLAADAMSKHQELEDRGSEKTYVALAPPIVLRLAQRDALSHPVTGKLQVLSSAEQGLSDANTEARRRIACVITGTAAGLPGQDSVFEPNNLSKLLQGRQCIAAVSGSLKQAMMEKNVVQLRKHRDANSGSVRTERLPVDTEAGVIKLAAQLGHLDLTTSYGIPPGLAQTMDVAAQVAVAAGMEALRDAGLVTGNSPDPSAWMLPESLRDGTGVVYASSFPAMDAAVGEVMRFLQSKTVAAADSIRLIAALRSRLLRAQHDRCLSDDDEAAFARLAARARECDGAPDACRPFGSEDENLIGNGEHHENSQKQQQPQQQPPPSSVAGGGCYEFDRKFLFRVLVLGNAQLAQLTGARGPNTQTNAACAGTTQAIAMAQDMLVSGRADRVVVVAGDNASGGTLMPWLGCGFRALGAACTASAVEDAACPFDERRSGLLLGAGGIGMVLETEQSFADRQDRHAAETFSSSNPASGAGTGAGSTARGKAPVVKARLLATQYSNSAFHGAALDRHHIGSELKRFFEEVELVHGIGKAEIASHGVYLSHETGTHATAASSCAGNEVAALRYAFADDDLLQKMLVLNTKGFTGHPMGVSFEDVTAVEVLFRQSVPAVPNYRQSDGYLGPLNLCTQSGPYACRYALRFAAGFGSQVAFALYAVAQYD